MDETLHSISAETVAITVVIATVILFFVLLSLRLKSAPQSKSHDVPTDEKAASAKPTPVSKKKKGAPEKRKDSKIPYSHRWLLTTLKGHGGSVLDLDFSGNGKYLASCADGAPLCWKSGDAHQDWKEVSDNRTSKKSNSSKNSRKWESPNYIIKRSSKIHSPLQMYVTMVMDEKDLYHLLHNYILSTEEQKDCGFPMEDHREQGRVWYGGGYSFANPDPAVRECCRCSKTFAVTEDGCNLSDEDCIFHWGKKKTLKKNSRSVYDCCDQDEDSVGCSRNKYHVSTQIYAYNGFVKTRKKRLGNGSTSFGICALDCEMCFTAKGLEVAKVSVVGPDGLCIYDSLVLPENPIIDYNTNFSGITAKDLKNVRTTLADVHAVLLKLLNSNTILIGHGLENDLKALRIIHGTLIDTSVVFPHYYGLPYRRSLKSLIRSYLRKNIQENRSGHDSAEDARACMELMLWKVLKDKQLHENGKNLRPANSV